MAPSEEVLANGLHPAPTAINPMQISFPMPHAPQIQVHAHLSVLQRCLMLFLTTSGGGGDGPASQSSMGSFVYAMPNVSSSPLGGHGLFAADGVWILTLARSRQRTHAASPPPPLCTTLYGSSSSSSQLDFATRMARIIARKTGKPTYVGNSVSFASTGRGGAVEEEMDGLHRCIEVVMKMVEKAETGKGAAVGAG